MGKIVNIFRGAGEVNKFTDRIELGIVSNGLLEQVLDRFYIMVGGALNRLNPQSLINRKIVDQLVENAIGFITKGGHFTDTRMIGQMLQPANLNHHPIADQAIFTEDRSKLIGFASIAAINRRNGGQGREREIVHCYSRCGRELSRTS